jgi:hypothetical protein
MAFLVWVMVFNTFFKKNSVISWGSVLSTSLLFLWSEEKGLELWWLTPIFQQYFSYILAVSFIGERNRSTRRKPLTDKSSHLKYTSPSSGIKLTTLVVICSDCAGSCRSSYQTIMNIAFQKNIYSGFVILAINVLRFTVFDYKHMESPNFSILML